MVAWGVVAICYCWEGKGVVVAVPDWITAGKLAALAVIEVLGY